MKYSDLHPSLARRLISYMLDRIRRDASLTHSELGRLLGVSRASFSQIVAGKALPSKPAIEVIVNHLGATRYLDDLTGLLARAKSKDPQNNTFAKCPRRGADLTQALVHTAIKVEIFSPIELPSLIRSTRLTSSDLEVFALPENATQELRSLSGFTIAHAEGGFKTIHEETNYFSYTYDASNVVRYYEQLMTEIRRTALPLRSGTESNDPIY